MPYLGIGHIRLREKPKASRLARKLGVFLTARVKVLKETAHALHADQQDSMGQLRISDPAFLNHIRYLNETSLRYGEKFLGIFGSGKVWHWDCFAYS